MNIIKGKKTEKKRRINWKIPITWIYSNYWEIGEKRRLKELYSKFVETGDLVFDIGANKGVHSMVMYELGARVVAVEPNPEMFPFLERNRRKIFDIQKVGIGKENREMDLNVYNEKGHSTFMDNSPKVSAFHQTGTYKTQIITLKDLLDKFPRDTPTFIKIDVEGFEWEVIQTLNKPVKYITFEFSPSIFSVARKCIDFLESKGYEFNYSLSIFHKLKLTEWVDGMILKGTVNQRNLLGMVYARLK